MAQNDTAKPHFDKFNVTYSAVSLSQSKTDCGRTHINNLGARTPHPYCTLEFIGIAYIFSSVYKGFV